MSGEPEVQQQPAPAVADKPEGPQQPAAPPPAAPQPSVSAADGAAGEDGKDGMPDDFVVDDKASIGQERIHRQLDDTLGPVGATRTGNITNQGQTAVGDGAMAAESILYTTFNLGRKSKSWLGVVPRDHVARLAAAYVPGPSDEELAKALRVRNVVYLSAHPGCGRYAAARFALARRHAHDRVAMIHVPPGERIVEAVDDDMYLEDHGHVVDAARAHEIEFIDLLSLDRQARERGATVVVVGPLADRGHDLGSYLLRHQRSTALAVFGRQLSHLLGERNLCVAECGDGCVRDCVPRYIDTCVGHAAVRRHLNETMPLEEAARIAAVLSAAPAGADLDELLADLFHQRMRAQAHIVLRASDDESRGDTQRWSADPEYRRAFRVAFAALEGAPMASVYRAAEQLFRLQGDVGEEIGPVAPKEFELDCLLEYGMQVPGRDAVAPGTPRVAQLANPELVPAMLDVAWNERGLGARLMRWLDTLAADGRQIVRERAAMVAGMLSFNDFDAVMEGLITPWARSRRIVLRQAAGLSLLSCAHNPAVRGKLQKLVDGWMGTSGSVYTRDSVAWAYAYGLGGRLPQPGLRHLRRIGEDSWQKRSFLLAIGVEQSYRRERAARVLGELRDWVAAGDEGRRLQVHAVRSFVRLARLETDLGAVRWPELLLRRHRDDLGEDVLADLWVAALSLPSSAASAWQAFTGWLMLGEHSAQVADELLRLIRRLVRDLAIRSRMAHQCDHVWRRQRPPSPLLDAAAAIIGEE